MFHSLGLSLLVGWKKVSSRNFPQEATWLTRFTWKLSNTKKLDAQWAFLILESWTIRMKTPSNEVVSRMFRVAHRWLRTGRRMLRLKVPTQDAWTNVLRWNPKNNLSMKTLHWRARLQSTNKHSTSLRKPGRAPIHTMTGEQRCRQMGKLF